MVMAGFESGPGHDTDPSIGTATSHPSIDLIPTRRRADPEASLVHLMDPPGPNYPMDPSADPSVNVACRDPSIHLSYTPSLYRSDPR